MSEYEKKKAVLELLRQRELIEADSVLKYIKLNLVQKAFVLSKSRIRVLSGANQSGKSTAGAVDMAIRSGNGLPDQIKDFYPNEMMKPGKYWAVALDFPTSFEVQQVKVEDVFPKRNVVKKNREPRYIDYRNGTRVSFKSAESGREKFQGAVLDGLWDDEEIKEEIFNEQYMRIVAREGWLTMTFSPIKGLTWANEKLWKLAFQHVFTENVHGIKEEVGVVHSLEEIAQLRERRLVVRKNTSGSDPSIEAFQMSIYDNIHIADQEIQNTERRFKDDIPAYNSRILGRFSKLSGRNVFPIEPLMKMQGTCPTTFKRGDVVKGKWVESVKGPMVVFSEPKKGERYVVAGDPSGGIEDGDPACIQILNHKTAEQVAIWHGKCHPEEFGSILINIGTYYNKAIICPETNFHGFGVVKRIRDQGYSRLFSEYDIPSDTIKVHDNQPAGRKTWGWRTTPKTKPIMIQELCQYIADGLIKINDPHTIDELMSYVYDDAGHTNALKGCKDDRVVGLAIALQVKIRKPVPRFEMKKPTYTRRRKDSTTGYDY